MPNNKLAQLLIRLFFSSRKTKKKNYILNINKTGEETEIPNVTKCMMSYNSQCIQVIK